MSASPAQHRVVAITAVLLAASAVPALAPSAAATTAGPNASFAPQVVHEHRGDVANITVHTSDGGLVNLGSPSKGFWIQVRVGDGTTKLRLNTYKVGMAETRAGVKAAVSGGTVVDLKITPLHKPLAVAKYTMNVTRNGQEIGVGAFVVEERANYGVSTRIAPRAVPVETIASEKGVRKISVPPDGMVAYDDWLVVGVNATGVSGALRTAPANTTVMRVEFEHLNPPLNRDPNRFNASLRDAFTFGGEEGFYLAINTGEPKYDIDPGDRYRVSFVVPAASPLATDRRNVSTEIEVVERRVELRRNGPGEAVVVNGTTKINGTTTLTPGTTINVTARDAALPPFHLSQTVTVRGDRTFATTFDFRDVERGREFQIRLPDQERTVPGMVAPQTTTTVRTTTTTATTATTTTTTSTTATATTTTTADGLTQVAARATEKPLTQRRVGNGSSATGQNANSGPVPGFGAGVGLLAVAAGGLLAARRR